MTGLIAAAAALAARAARCALRASAGRRPGHIW
jgi:hypothetical protein